MNKPLIFDIALGRTKPVNIRNEQIRCPFCDTQSLTDILAQEGNMIWLMNKYPVLQYTWPTVVIETDNDEGEFSQYSISEATKVINFSLRKWEETKQSGRFQSVLFFKNHGPMSGGSLRHPHSQIIGLETYDYTEDITTDHMDGWLVWDKDVRITMSKVPLIGFFEFNMRFTPITTPRIIALRLQQILQYVLANMARMSQSYNYFFYDLHDGYYYIKVVPRYITTPLYVGYKIPQTCDDDRATKIIHSLRKYLQP